MTSSENRPPVELRAETEADRPFGEGLVRAQLLDAMSGVAGFEPGPMVEMQIRARAATLAHNFPDLEGRVAWVGEARAGLLLTGTLDGALHVVEIITAADRRRSGVAAAMLAQVIREARDRGWGVSAHIFTGNTASLALFSGAGFSIDLPPEAAQAVATLATDTGGL